MRKRKRLKDTVSQLAQGESPGNRLTVPGQGSLGTNLILFDCSFPDFKNQLDPILDGFFRIGLLCFPVEMKISCSIFKQWLFICYAS